MQNWMEVSAFEMVEVETPDSVWHFLQGWSNKATKKEIWTFDTSQNKTGGDGV